MSRTDVPSRPDLPELADRLWTAEAERHPIRALTDERPDLTVNDAYAIQHSNVQRRVEAGGVVRGRKVGLTSRAMQDLLGVAEPTFGVLFDDMFVEAEIAFTMAHDLSGPGVTTTQALSAIDSVMPALEIGDSRIADWRLKLPDTVADNGSSGRVVVGRTAASVTELDLRLLGVLFYRNGVPIDSGAGAAALGHPASCVAWLANKLSSLGAGLRHGDVVLSGALHRMVAVRPGDVVRAEFAHLGSVSARFSRPAPA
jgi:2-keto-4-pentenoate hydratase